MDGPKQCSSPGVPGRGPADRCAAKWLRHQPFIMAAPLLCCGARNATPDRRTAAATQHGNASNVMAALFNLQPLFGYFTDAAVWWVIRNKASTPHQEHACTCARTTASSFGSVLPCLNPN